MYTLPDMPVTMTEWTSDILGILITREREEHSGEDAEQVNIDYKECRLPR